MTSSRRAAGRGRHLFSRRSERPSKNVQTVVTVTPVGDGRQPTRVERTGAARTMEGGAAPDFEFGAHSPSHLSQEIPMPPKEDRRLPDLQGSRPNFVQLVRQEVE